MLYDAFAMNTETTRPNDRTGGGNETRTRDLCDANAALSQLSYTPSFLPSPSGEKGDIPLNAPEKDVSPLDFDRVAANFAKHVDRSGGPKACWPWTGTKQSKGYGCLGFRCADGVDRRFLAHRVALMLATAQHFVLEMQVMHSCDNRPCCNPRHLFVGTQSDNMRDCLAKGRMFIPGVVDPRKSLTDSGARLARELVAG